MAAVLACGPGALLSHRSAAALWGLRPSSLSYVEVTVASRRGRIDGVRAYISTRVQPQDRDEIDGIPCTSLALTLLNLAAVSPRRAVERACDEAEIQEVFDLVAIDEVLQRSRGCRGAPLLRAVLAEHAIGTTLTRPGLEERTLELLDDAEIPRPEVNVRLPCGAGVAPEVDFLWRRERLVLETDGGRFHSTRVRSNATGARRPRSSAPATACCARPGCRCNASRARSRGWSRRRSSTAPASARSHRRAVAARIAPMAPPSR